MLKKLGSVCRDAVYLTCAGMMLLTASHAWAVETAGPAVTRDSVAWFTALQGFKAQLHALAGEALILQLKTSSSALLESGAADRQIRWDSQTRLSDSLRSANALLSMLEIADHSDRSPRVRQILSLWLDSSRRSIADHLENAAAASSAEAPDPSTAEFLEELKILWRRLDSAYAELEEALAVPGENSAVPANG